MAPRETENNAYAKFWCDKKENYGMLWYFLEWSIFHASRVALIRNGNQPFGFTVISPLNYPAMTNTNLSILIIAIWFGGEMTRNHESYSTER